MRCRWLLFLPLILVFIPFVFAEITFQLSVIDEIEINGVEDGFYNVSYKDQWVCFTPYLMLDGREVKPEALMEDKYSSASVTHVVKQLDNEGKYLRTGTENKHEELQSIEWGYRVDNIPTLTARTLSECGYRIKSNKEYKTYMVEDVNVYELQYGNIVIDFSDVAKKYSQVALTKNKLSVNNLENVKSLDLDPVTYSAPIITVTGGTAGAPVDFKDVWDADQAGGWGVVSTNCEYTQFCFGAGLKIGNDVTTTYFNDTRKQITFNSTVDIGWRGRNLRVENNAYFTLGQLIDDTVKTTREGCSLHMMKGNLFDAISTDANGECNLYGSQLLAPSRTRNLIKGRVWNCLFNFCDFVDGPTDIFRLTMMRPGYAINLLTGSVMDEIIMYNSQTTCIETPSGAGWDFSVSNTKFIDSDGNVVNFRMNSDLSLIDCEIGDYTTLIWYSGTITGEIYLQYTWNIIVRNSTGYPLENATVTLIQDDASNAFSVNTSSDGTITEQTVTRGHYNQTGGQTMYDYGPFHLQVTHPDYQTYHMYNMTLDAPVDLKIGLLDPVTAGGPFYLMGIPLILLGSAYYIGRKR